MTRIARTLLISATGVGVFLALGLPLPFLLGSLAACLVSALAGIGLRESRPASTLARTVLGAAIGASVTVELLGRIPSMLISLALVPAYIALIALIGVPFFRRVCGFDAKTAYYAAMPGGAADMAVFAEEAGANTRQVSLVHVTRLLVIILVAPLVLVLLYGVDLTRPIGRPAAEIAALDLLLLTVAALAGWGIARRIGLFGAAIIGPMILAALLSLTGLLHSRPPKEALLAAQFLLGTGIGVSYVGVTLRELRNVVAGAAAFVLILGVLAAIFTEIVILSGLAPPVEGFLSFAPGGQAEMSMLALIAGADLGVVVVHHLTRISLVLLLAPVFARWLAP